MLEGCLQRTERARWAADKMWFTAGEWAEERECAWKRVRKAVRESQAVVAGDMVEVETCFEPAVRRTDRLYRVACANRQML